MKITPIIIFFSINLIGINSAKGQISRIWLTHRTNEPSHLVVNWQSNKPGNSEVRFHTGNGKEHRIIVAGETTLHHVEIPLKEKDVPYYYEVITGNEKSKSHIFKAYPSDRKKLRVAVVGNWGYSGCPDLSALIQDDPHLLLTLGDNIQNLHDLCGEGVTDCIEPFLKLIDSSPELFQTTPFMPILGNHDKEIRERGTKYPQLPVYDIDATAYRNFFELPDSEWKWDFNVPDFNVCFVALDLNHISDFGSTWQTCHDFHLGSEQMEWFREILKINQGTNIITLQNEKNQSIRSQEKGEWGKLFQKGAAVISGYGYFSERAEVEGFPYFNTSLKAGDKYPDEFSKILQGVSGYILMTISKEALTVEMKSLKGNLIDRYLMFSTKSFPKIKIN